MKYLVVSQFSNGTTETLNYKSLKEAKSRLKDVEAFYKNTLIVDWESDTSLVARNTGSDWVRVSIYKTRSSTKKKVAIGLALTTAVAIGTVVATLDWQLMIDEGKAANFTASSEINTMADSLYLTRRGRAVFYASQPALLKSSNFNSSCGADGGTTFTSGCYYHDDDGTEHIDIYDIGTEILNENGLTYDFGVFRTTIAHHEFLHAVWSRFGVFKQDSVCGNLKTLAKDIPNLEEEMRLYSSSSVCTELFARVGSEFIGLVSPNNSVSASSDIPATYASLSSSGKEAAAELTKLYDEYFDTTKQDHFISYWKNETQFKNYEKMIRDYQTNITEKEKEASDLISKYYAWSTSSRYNAAMRAVDEYNAMIESYNSYVATYNKVASRLDSEQSITTRDLLDL